MKNLFILFTIISLCAFTGLKDPLTEKERKFATDYLTTMQTKLVDITKGLNEAQLKYKSSPDKWSVEDCVKHIAMAEMGLWHAADSIIKTPENPEKRSEIKKNDEELIKMITDRSFKAQAPEPMKPENTPFKSYSEAIESFKENRAKLVEYVNTTDKHLRNHVVAFPMGHFDTYQMILFIGAHSSRHTLQIEEVMADPGFPKN